MVKSAKEIACAGITVALLIGGQYAFSMVSGIEIVTAIFALYCLVFGGLSGVVVAVAFSFLRCFIFGFFPQVIILYLVYYTIFAIVVGLIGKSLEGRKSWLVVLVLTATCVVLTILFTAIDNVINAVFFGLTTSALKIYVLQAVPVLIRQIICVAITVPLFYYPLEKIFKIAKSK